MSLKYIHLKVAYAVLMYVSGVQSENEKYLKVIPLK